MAAKISFCQISQILFYAFLLFLKIPIKYVFFGYDQSFIPFLKKNANGTVRELVFPKGLDLDRPKRARTTFTNDQLAQLEREFRRNQYLVGRERSLLAQRLGLSETQVKVWYQNRRTKHKRDRDRESEAPNPLMGPRLPSAIPSLTMVTPTSHTSMFTMAPTALTSTSITTTSLTHPLETVTSISSSDEISNLTCSSEPGAASKISVSPIKGSTRENHLKEKLEEPKSQNTHSAHIRMANTVANSMLDYHVIGEMGHSHSVKREVPTRFPIGFPKGFPALLGAFHTMPPAPVQTSAFSPLIPRPFHPLALQHHPFTHPHQTWLP
ncbi:unnamed protein product, partial [Meganyctiphanes norvegica]